MWNPLKEFNINSLKINELKKLENTFFIKRNNLGKLVEIENIINYFFQNLTPIIETEKNVKVYSLKLKQPNNNNVEICFYETNCYIPYLETYQKSIVLWNIFIPEYLGNKGLATKIFNYLELLSQKKKKCFIVQLILSDILLNICKKRNYKPRPPFSMYSIPNSFRLDCSNSEKIKQFKFEVSSSELNKIQTLEMSNLDPNVLSQFYFGFKKEFESNFNVGKNGTLKADWKSLQSIGTFVSKYQLIIMSTSSLIIVNPNFKKAYRGDIGTVNENKSKLLQVYSVCFVSYVKVCVAIRVKLDPKFNLISKTEDIIIIEENPDV